ncbi:hypothetical protein [Gordonia malaquae]|uniref:hypothetical protein n=1 Tax=Gordonia malaquae TaxID=410332 RepID=UPI0030181E64
MAPRTAQTPDVFVGEASKMMEHAGRTMQHGGAIASAAEQASQSVQIGAAGTALAVKAGELRARMNQQAQIVEATSQKVTTYTAQNQDLQAQGAAAMNAIPV